MSKRRLLIAFAALASLARQARGTVLVEYDAAGGLAPDAFSCHFERGPYPAGGNALFGDGHVGWRQWKQMALVRDSGSFNRWF